MRIDDRSHRLIFARNVLFQLRDITAKPGAALYLRPSVSLPAPCSAIVTVGAHEPRIRPRLGLGEQLRGTVDGGLRKRC